MASYIDPTRESFAAFREMRREGRVHMLNLLRFRDRAALGFRQGRLRRSGLPPYASESAPIFRRLGGKQVWIGWPELTLTGPPEKHWQLVFIAEYPSVDAFVSMLRDPDHRKAVRHRQAAVEGSRLIRMKPSEPGASFGEIRG